MQGVICNFQSYVIGNEGSQFFNKIIREDHGHQQLLLKLINKQIHFIAHLYFRRFVFFVSCRIFAGKKEKKSVKLLFVFLACRLLSGWERLFQYDNIFSGALPSHMVATPEIQQKKAFSKTLFSYK